MLIKPGDLLSSTQRSNIQRELRENIVLNTGAVLSCDARRAKIAQLREHAGTMAIGKPKDKLEKLILAEESRTADIAAANEMQKAIQCSISTEAASTRTQVTEALTVAKEEIIKEVWQHCSLSSAPASIVDCSVPLEDMPAFVKRAVVGASDLVNTCKLTRNGLTRYARALQCLADEPPLVCAWPDLRAMNVLDLTEMVHKLSIRQWHGAGKITYQNLQNVREDIMKHCSDPTFDYARNACESRIYVRNLSFVSKQSNVLPPGTLLHCHIKKSLCTAVVLEPTVWTEVGSMVLAYRIMNLDKDMQVCSIPATAIAKVLHVTDVTVHFEMPVQAAGGNVRTNELVE